jgi:hypothetical protein
MCPLSSTARSISNSQISGEAGDFTDSYTGEDDNKTLIAQANSIFLVRIFKMYGINVNEHNRKIICPFKSHSGGHENSASFYYYPNTNSFFCFGCRKGGPVSHGCEFVAAMECISKIRAAHKILELFSSDVDEFSVPEANNVSERMEIMMNFSNTVREFRQIHTDEKSYEFIEFCCRVYDQHNLKRDLDNEVLRNIVEQLKETIEVYTP